MGARITVRSELSFGGWRRAQDTGGSPEQNTGSPRARVTRDEADGPVPIPVELRCMPNVFAVGGLSNLSLLSHILSAKTSPITPSSAPSPARVDAVVSLRARVTRWKDASAAKHKSQQCIPRADELPFSSKPHSMAKHPGVSLNSSYGGCPA